MFFIKGCTFSACRYYGNIITDVKLCKSRCPLFLNLNRKVSLNFKLLSAEKNLSASEVSVKKYLNHLMDAYKNQQKGKDGVFEIIKLHNVQSLLNEKIKLAENIRSLSDILSDNAEMKNLVKEEELIYEQQLLQVDEQILDIILQYVSMEHFGNVIVEIIPGVGGQEAMLFAKDLFNLYTSYFDYLGFSYEIIELIKTETHGIRKAGLFITDNNAFKKLKYEGGVHRVQRIPATEKSSRLHTSTAVVSIIPEPRDVDVILKEKDLKIESMKASGAGGQHVNSTNSAVRITHIPTGTAVTCQTDRSQIKNKTLALIKLKSILYHEQLDKQTSFISELRKKQMGMKLRNEKIRTYNFSQDRVTDHRISNGTMYNLKEFMNGGAGLNELEDRLYKDMQKKTLLEIIEKTETQLK